MLTTGQGYPSPNEGRSLVGLFKPGFVRCSTATGTEGIVPLLALNYVPMRPIYIYQKGRAKMTDFSEISTARLAETVALHDHPKTAIEGLSELVATQAGEKRRLTAENRILWDLLLFDLPKVEKYEGDDSSTFDERGRAPHQKEP
jgi:hypothetical protein